MHKGLIDANELWDEVEKSKHDNPHTIAVEVVRCKDCVHRGCAIYCPMCLEEWYEIDEGDGYYDLDFITHDYTIDDGFCDCGERKDNDLRGA